MAPLTIRILGHVKIALGDERLTDFRTRKVEALLIYLAAERGAHSRDLLMNLLWPGMPERSARTNLRQILYYLRKQLPDPDGGKGRDPASLVIANRRHIRLNPQASFSVDTQRFEELLDGIQAHEHLELHLCQTCAAALEEAVALYRGDFLADFYLEDSDDFEEWAQARRESYRRQVLDALTILTTVALRGTDYAAAQALVERQLAIDNLREAGYRQLMEVLARNGQREQALAVYESCRRVLLEELSMEPTARTTEVYESIRSGGFRPGSTRGGGIRGYELKEQLAEGAYGTIHRAIQPAILREVAVKVIRRQYANDPEFIRRFEFEAQIIARLEHPHIVPLYDYWRDPQGAYLVMRYMRGGSLLDTLRDGPLDSASASRTLEQVAAALASAHAQGVVHRDIKPGNILLDEAGNAYLADFGIAGNLGGDQPSTADGSALDTLDYVSPEQVMSESVTPQTDIYSLGAVLYEMLTGEKPFGDSTVERLLYSHLNELIPPVAATRPDIPAEVDMVLQTATAKDPRQRYDSALDLARAFRSAVRGGLTTGVEVVQSVVPELGKICNPYKGLYAFQEADADDFFGRDTLIEQLLERLGAGASDTDQRFLALVGPSGSGKSSAIKAGLIPALRDGALPGSASWFITEMVPGTNPLEELEKALWRVAVDPPPDLVKPMQRDTAGMLRTIRRVLPAEAGAHGLEPPRLLLVIDQFEELFTLVEQEAQRVFFLNSLLAALSAPRSPLVVVITLRADFYDRPLQYQEWGQLLRRNTEVILPLNRSELTWAVREPALRLGVRLEEGLAAHIVSDVAEQPGALPLLQYALTELFEQREGLRLTRAAYEEMGRVQGALGRRAESVYASLDDPGRRIARQLLLRLVTLGEGAEDTRRRVLRSELDSIEEAVPADQSASAQVDKVLFELGAARFLTFDRDPQTRAPTVEIAHEALLRAWPRLQRWLMESRDDLRLQRLLLQMTGEWLEADRDDGYLLRDARLDQFAGWMDETNVSLTRAERAFLERSLAARRARQAAEEARRQRELDTARQLAETERQRAAEQAQAAVNLRQRAVYLGAALVVAIILAVAAGLLGQSSADNARTAQQEASDRATAQAQAQANLVLATTREAEAVANADLASSREEEALSQRATAQAEAVIRATAEAIAVAEREIAQSQADLATARELAAAALVSLESDPERSILLALQSLELTHTAEGEEAVRRSLVSSRVRLAMTGTPPDYHIAGMIYDVTGGHLISTRDDSESRYLTVWDSETGAQVAELLLDACDDQCPTNVAMSPDGRQIAAFGADSSILILDWPASLAAGNVQIQHRLEGHTAGPLAVGMTGVVFSPDGTLLASTSWDNTLKVWDLVDATLRYSLEIPTNFMLGGPTFSPDGRLLTVVDIHRVKEVGPMVYDAASGEALFELPIDVRAIRFHKDGRLLLTLTHESITAWDLPASLAAGAPQELYIKQLDRFIDYLSARLNPDNSLLAVASQDGNALVLRIGETSVEEELFLSSHIDFQGVAFSPNGRHLATRGAGTIQIWDITTAGASEVLTFQAHPGTIRSVTQNRDGTVLATAGWAGGARTWDANTGEMLRQFVGHSGRVNDVAFSPDDARLVTAGSDRTARVWDAATGEEVAILDASGEGSIGGVHEGVMTVAFAPDGSLIATGAADGTVRLWDARTYAPVERIVMNPDADGRSPLGITNVTFSPDGTLIAAATDGTFSTSALLRVWEVRAGKVLLEETAERRIWGLAFSPDGTQVAIDGFGEPFKVWDLSSGERLLETVLTGPARDVYQYSPDGATIVTSGPNDGMIVWDAATGSVLKEFEIPGSAIFSTDGSRLIISGQTGLIHIVTLDVEQLIALAGSRVTRQLTEAECQSYLHVAACPP